MKRREFVFKTALGLTGAATAAPQRSLARRPKSPFSLGIASGDVTDTAAILWTRLAPEPLAANGGMGPDDVEVSWELSSDDRMSRVLRHGEGLATPELGHSVHIDLQGLDPGREYWYRFRALGHESPIGRTKTLPARSGPLVSLRFATASCQNYTHGYFVAYRHMVQDQPDFVIHLGDYIYDTSFGESFRRHETETPPVTLDEFRRRHALYKTDEHLQLAHAQLPFFVTIDNHDAIEDRDPSKFEQRAAAYQAWYEHMPVRGYGGVGENRFDICRKIQLGDLAQIALLDSRQFRDKRDLCRESMDPSYGFGNYRESCDTVMADGRTMLGQDQERWLLDSLRGNQARWNVMASPGPFLPFRYHVDGKVLSYIGAWDAYPANRRRIANGIFQSKTGHPLVLSGDVHSFWALDGALARDGEEHIPVVEFITSSISANWPTPLAKPVSDNLLQNPHVRFYEPNRRGYLIHELSPTQWRTTMRAVEDVKDRQSRAFNLASFEVTHGASGIVRADR